MIAVELILKVSAARRKKLTFKGKGELLYAVQVFK